MTVKTFNTSMRVSGIKRIDVDIGLREVTGLIRSGEPQLPLTAYIMGLERTFGNQMCGINYQGDVQVVRGWWCINGNQIKEVTDREREVLDALSELYRLLTPFETDKARAEIEQWGTANDWG